MKNKSQADAQNDSETVTCPNGGIIEGYKDIKNRPPVVIKTWHELMDGLSGSCQDHNDSEDCDSED
jgi:hypothetical protein